MCCAVDFADSDWIMVPGHNVFDSLNQGIGNVNSKEGSVYAALVYRYPNEGLSLSVSKRDAFAPTLEFISQTSVTLRCLLPLWRNEAEGRSATVGLVGIDGSLGEPSP
jgi:hypothetical protein